VACKWWLVGNAAVPDDKVVVMGGSYGGYMALAAEGFAPDEFAANVDYFGVSDLKTLGAVDRMKRPLLVVQGDHVPRVTKEQSDRIVEALRARKVPVEYLVLDNEGHGFSRTDSMLRAYGATDAFLDRYLLGGGAR